MPLILSGNVATELGTGYEVANSCRFDTGGTACLTRSLGTATSEKIGTWSYWVKRCHLGAVQMIYGNEVADDNNRGYISFHSDDAWRMVDEAGSGTELKTNRVFRDIGAWYHIVVRVDTTQGTASNRVKLYVNGVQETSFATATYPAEDDELKIFEGGQTNKQHIGKQHSETTGPLDAYLAEFVFCDGQSLAQTEFGEFDSDSPTIWKPKDVSGLTFGTNGFYLDFETDGTNTAFTDSSSNARTVTATGDVNHSFTQSKFNGSSIYLDGSGDKLTMADSSDWDFGTGNFTWEAWIYKPHTGKESIFETRVTGDNDGFNMEFNASHKFEWYDPSIASGNDLPRDPNAITANTWTHYAVVRNGSTCTMYRDGTSVGTPKDVGSNSQTSAGLAIIGINMNATASTAFEGYFDDMRLSSTARYTSNFTAPTAAFTSDSDTVFLIQSKASNLIGADVSGQGNHFTSTNLAATDQASDSPTNNFCTLNPLAFENAGGTGRMSEGNLRLDGGSSTAHNLSVGTIAVNKGKWWFEAEIDAYGGDHPQIGIRSVDVNNALGQYVGEITGGAGYFGAGGAQIDGSTTVEGGGYATYTSGDIINVGLDLDNNKIYWYKNGSIVNSGGTTITNRYYTFSVSQYSNSGHWLCNFGASAPYTISSGNADENGYGNFEHAPVSGYLSLCTKNLAEEG